MTGIGKDCQSKGSSEVRRPVLGSGVDKRHPGGPAFHLKVKAGEGYRLRHAMIDPQSGRDAKAFRPAPAPPSAGASRPPGRALA